MKENKEVISKYLENTKIRKFVSDNLGLSLKNIRLESAIAEEFISRLHPFNFEGFTIASIFFILLFFCWVL